MRGFIVKRGKVCYDDTKVEKSEIRDKLANMESERGGKRYVWGEDSACVCDHACL